MAKRKLPERDSFAPSTTPGALAVSEAKAARATTEGLDQERTTLVLPRALRIEVERRI